METNLNEKFKKDFENFEKLKIEFERLESDGGIYKLKFI